MHDIQTRIHACYNIYFMVCVLACFGQVPWFKLLGWTFNLPSAPPHRCDVICITLALVFLDLCLHGLVMQHLGLNACKTMHVYVS